MCVCVRVYARACLANLCVFGGIVSILLYG